MTDDIHIIAIRYFDGTITKEEETRLEAYVNAAPEHLIQFRDWEAEWAETHPMSSQAEASYERFVELTQQRLQQRKGINRIWRRVAAVAAVVVLMAGSAFTAWQLAGNVPENYYTCNVPYGSKTCIELPDGSLVWLNAGSKLRYSTRFNADNRVVELDGEGYFDVRHQNGKTFVVKTQACDVTVKGTRFDVSAYSDDPTTAVSLMQGSVQVNSSSDELTIRPEEKVVVDKTSGKISKAVYAATANTWIDNNLDFEAITLSELTRILARQFNVHFVIQSARLADMRFSVILKQKENIADVMDALQTIQPMKIVKKGKYIYISD